MRKKLKQKQKVYKEEENTKKEGMREGGNKGMEVMNE